MDRFISISKAAKLLGVSISTLRRWESEGKISSEPRTGSDHRRYDLAKIKPESFRLSPDCRKTIAYARVNGSRSRKNQKLIEGMKRVVDDVTGYLQPMK
jgi:excisionase family DNA binding protein